MEKTNQYLFLEQMFISDKTESSVLEKAKKSLRMLMNEETSKLRNKNDIYKIMRSYKDSINSFFDEKVIPLYEEENKDCENSQKCVNKVKREFFATLRGSPSGGGNNAIKNILNEIKETNDFDGYKCELFKDDFGNPVLFPTGTMSFIMARPACGKTTSLISIALDSLRMGKKVLFITTEETLKSIILRMIANQFCFNIINEDKKTLLNSKLPKQYSKIKQYFNAIIKYEGKIEEEELKQNFEFNEMIIKAKNEVLNFNETGKVRFFDIDKADSFEDVIDEIQDQPEGTLILYDYIQNVTLLPKGISPTTDMREQLRQISNKINTSCKSNDLIGIVAAQTNRDGEGKNGEADTLELSNMAEAGALERVAHIVIGLGKKGEGENKKRFYRIVKDREGQDSKKYFINTDEHKINGIDYPNSFSYFAFSYIDKLKTQEIVNLNTKTEKKKTNTKSAINNSTTAMFMNIHGGNNETTK